MKVSYDKTWTEDNEVAIAELFDLSEDQVTKLFTDHKTIVVADSFKQKWEQLQSRIKSDRDVETAEQPIVKDVSIAGSHAKLARDMADVIKNDSEINARVKLTIVSGEEVKRGPLALCLLMENRYNKTGSNMTLAMFPDHDAKGWEQTIEHDDGTKEKIAASDNPAQWKRKVDKKMVTFDFYQVYADDTVFGEECAGALEACQNAQAKFKEAGSAKGIASYTTTSGEVLEFSKMTGHDIDAETRTWSQRRSRLAGQYRAAVRLHKQIAKLSEYDGINLTVAKRPDGTLKRVTSPITIQDANDLGEYKQFTPMSLLNLDIDKAVNNGSTYESLMTTIKKAQPDDGGEKLVESIKSAKTADEYVAELVSYLQKKKPSGEFAFNVYLNEKDKDGVFVHDDLLLSCRTLSDILDSILSKHERRLGELDEAGSEEKTGS